MFRFIGILGLSLAATLCNGQAQFTEYVGEIKTGIAPTALAGDPQGRLYYGTFNLTGAIFSHVRMIEDPVAAINSPNEAGTTVAVMTGTGKINASGRGVQSLDFASDNTMFVSGDNSGATFNNVWKFDYTAGPPPVFAEDTSFTANVRAEKPARRSGVSVVSESGNGLIVTCGFGSTSFVDYFDFDGHVVGDRITDDLYYRHIHYLPQYNVAYPFRNGQSNPEIVNSVITGINPATGGGTLTSIPLVPDGGTINSTGHSMQGGFYYAEQDQLFVLDALIDAAGNTTMRVFDVNENGTSVSLAYTVTGPSESELFTRINDVTVVGDHLYISTYEATNTYDTSRILVFRDPQAKVAGWREY